MFPSNLDLFLKFLKIKNLKQKKIYYVLMEKAFYLNKDFKKINFGIFKIISKSSKMLLLLDKNFITVFDEAENILKKIFGIFSGYFSKTLKNTSSRNLYLFPILNSFVLEIFSIFILIYLLCS